LKYNNRKSLIIFLFALVNTFFFIAPDITNASTFEFEPAIMEYNQGCSYSVNIIIDTNGVESNSADIIINYDPFKIDILDSNLIKSGLQIQPGTVYDTYFGNQIDTNTGEIRLTGATFSGSFNGRGTFASIKFKSKSSITSADFNINIIGTGENISLDSNIVSAISSNDTLSSVINGKYTFISKSCIPDTIAPLIAFITPQNNQTNVLPGSDIQINIQDSDSGIDLSTVKITINDFVYDQNDERFTYTGTDSNYIITIDPYTDFPLDKISTITTRVEDKEGNISKSSITFNTPKTPEDREAPLITFLHPKEGDTIGLTDRISIRIIDKDSKVNINAVELTLNGVIYTLNDSEFTYIEDVNGYIIYLQPSSPLPTNKSSKLTIFSQDNLGNIILQSITFNVPKVIPPKTEISKIISHIGGFLLEATDLTTKFIDKSEEITIISAIATITVIAPTAIVGTTVTIIELPLLIQRFIFGILGFLGIRKKGKNFGYVYDSITKSPLSLAIVRFYNKAGQLIRTEITNSYGQFNSTIDDGEYKLVISKAEYKFPSKIILGNTDGPIANIYHGQTSKFNSKDISNLSIPMDPRGISIKVGTYKLKKLLLFTWNTIGFLLFAVGFIQSIMHLRNTLTTLNMAIFFVYLILLVILILKINPFRRSLGIVYKNKKKMSGIKIILKKLGEDKILDHRVTDKNGKYTFVVPHGSYKIELTNETSYNVKYGESLVHKGNKPIIFGRKININ